MTLANPLRGEVVLRVEGRDRILRLSLGALAALESALQADGLVALAERLERGGARADDVIDILTAGFLGAGAPLSREEVAALRIDGGAAAAVGAAMALVALAFGEAS
jgi:hypothetical protein